MAQTNHCGTCTMCCKLLDIPALGKPRDRWCTHCAIGRGCSVYDSRPAPCRDFVCLWLGSQERAKPLPPELRPDKCKIVFYYVENWRDLIGMVDPAAPDAWKAPPVQALLQSISKTGRRIMFGTSKAHYAVDRGKVRPVELGPPDKDGVRLFVRFLDE